MGPRHTPRSVSDDRKDSNGPKNCAPMSSVQFNRCPRNPSDRTRRASSIDLRPSPAGHSWNSCVLEYPIATQNLPTRSRAACARSTSLWNQVTRGHPRRLEHHHCLRMRTTRSRRPSSSSRDRSCRALLDWSRRTPGVAREPDSRLASGGHEVRQGRSSFSRHYGVLKRSLRHRSAAPAFVALGHNHLLIASTGARP